MKLLTRVTFLFVFSFSSKFSLAACPDLSGMWIGQCTVSGGVFELLPEDEEFPKFRVNEKEVERSVLVLSQNECLELNRVENGHRFPHLDLGKYSQTNSGPAISNSDYSVAASLTSNHAYFDDDGVLHSLQSQLGYQKDIKTHHVSNFIETYELVARDKLKVFKFHIYPREDFSEVVRWVCSYKKG